MPPRRLNPRLLSWASEIDPATAKQAADTAQLPFIAGHVALMPDAHLGKGATVGSVIPTTGAIIPAAVGVDIGCGMVATLTDLTAPDLPDDLRGLLTRIERGVPAGVGKGHDHLEAGEAWYAAHPPSADLSDRQVATTAAQFGTLGSGNHFLEVCLDETERVWLVLHSGSRGIGNQLAQRHIGIAKGLMRQWFVELPDPDLAYLVEGTKEFDAYIRDLRWAQDYAFASRERMADVALASLSAELRRPVAERHRVNCFAGETKVLTRHGAVPIASLAGGVHELLTTGGVWTKAPVRSFGRQRLMKVTLSRSGVLKTLYATPEHRWLIRSWREKLREAATSDVRPGDRLAYCFPARPAGLTLDEEGAARGFVFGDGSATPGPPRTYADGLTVVNGLPGGWKTELPGLDLPPCYLYGWLAGYFAADGDVDETGRPTLASADRAALEFVRTACAQVGVGTFGIRERRGVGFGREATALYLVGLMRGDLDASFFLLPHHRARFEAGLDGVAERRGWNVVAVEPTERYEEVFCATVEGSHTFALEDNILTGNCHHNYTARERHGGRDLWITRKGAILARAGVEGIVPGSMATGTYLVRGKGSAASYDSSAHGAGRRLSRSEARRRFTAADLAERMGDRTWLADRADKLVDEIPDSYKPIDQVMADQADLVEVTHVLRQVLNYKGT